MILKTYWRTLKFKTLILKHQMKSIQIHTKMYHEVSKYSYLNLLQLSHWMIHQYQKSIFQSNYVKLLILRLLRLKEIDHQLQLQLHFIFKDPEGEYNYKVNEFKMYKDIAWELAFATKINQNKERWRPNESITPG